MEEQQVVVTPSASDVKPEVTLPAEELPLQPVSEEVDEKGVPLKNRVEEMRRKMKEQQERLDALEAGNTALVERLEYQSQSNSNPPSHPEPEDQYILDARRIYREEQSRDTIATDKMEQQLAKFAQQNEYVAKLQQQISAKLRAYSPELRANPYCIAQVSNQVIGENIGSLIPKTGPVKPAVTPAPVKNLVEIPEVQPQTMSPKASGQLGSILLTPEEEEYADDNHLWEKGYTVNDIREQYQKRQAKKKK